MARHPPEWRYASLKGRVLRWALARRGSTLVGLDRAGRADLRIIRETRRRVPLLMQDLAALHILACVRAASGLGASMAEAGVFMGGSARLICEAKGAAPLHLFDAFEFLQSADALPDAAADEVRGYFKAFHSRLDAVSDLLRPYQRVDFHPGHFPGSARDLDPHERFGFVHLDLDLAQGTRDALELFWPRLVPGGIVIGDDYTLPAVRGAFEEFFATRAERPIALPWSQVLVVKNAG